MEQQHSHSNENTTTTNEEQTTASKKKKKREKRLTDDVLNSLKDLSGFPNLAAMLQAEAILRQRKAFNNIEEMKGDLKAEDQREESNHHELSGTVKAVIMPLAEDTMPTKFLDDLKAEQQRAQSNPHELNGMMEATLLPLEEDTMPKKLVSPRTITDAECLTGDLKAELQREKSNPCELNGRMEATLLPLEEDIMPKRLVSPRTVTDADCLTGDLKAEEQREKSNPHELYGTMKATLLPLVEDVTQIVVDACDEDICINVSGSKSTESTSVVTEDNAVLQKLLRGWRYFDSGNKNTHLQDRGAKSNADKQRTPCYRCGDVRHTGKKCLQRRICFTCNKRGHVAQDCPKGNQELDLCLRCGELGHDLFSCKNDYSPDDLKNIQCYICNKVGHLCCVSYFHTSPATPSCYNCGECGHLGLECPKPHNDAGVRQSRRAARKSYRHRRLKKQKMKELQQSVTEQ